MSIKPIRNDADHAEALTEIERLWGAKAETPESDRLEILLVLVHDYESRHHPVYPPDPIEAIKFRMEQAGLTRKDLEPILGSRARVSEVLSGKRRLSLSMIRSLHEQLGIPVESLLGLAPASSSRPLGQTASPTPADRLDIDKADIESQSIAGMDSETPAEDNSAQFKRRPRRCFPWLHHRESHHHGTAAQG